MTALATAAPIKNETVIAIDDRLIPSDEHHLMLKQLQEILHNEFVPIVFLGSRRPKVLKIGIHEDLLVRHPDADADKLSNWLQTWTNTTAYVKRITHGTNRHDLDGQDVGKITKAQRGHAHRVLRERTEQRSKEYGNE